MAGITHALSALRLSFLGLLMTWGVVQAQVDLEVLPLKSRSAEQVLPILLPLLEPGGGLTAVNQQLFLRASSRNREEIRRVLALIDVPARSLLIRVSKSRSLVDSERGVSAAAHVTVGRQAQASLAKSATRVWDTRRATGDDESQMIRVEEGSRAFIQIGQSLPLRLPVRAISPSGAMEAGTVYYQEIGRGFYVQPRLVGDRVTLEISLQTETVNTSAHGVDRIAVQRLGTTVSGRLGEWIGIGGNSRQTSGRETGTWQLSTRELDNASTLWLRVDELK